jgi:beta-fructofuranosidase
MSASLLSAVLLVASSTIPAAEPLLDKSLVVWVAPATLDQGGGSALTIDNGDGAFDAIVYGELQARRWMPGSNFWNRTGRGQERWPAETAGPGEFVQVAIVYRGREITMFRNGEPYAEYTMANPPQPFGPQAVVMFGRRHLDTHDDEHSFAGRIRDARIYAEPLDRAALAAMKPGQADPGRRPWAWWSFADEGLREKTGRYTRIQLAGGVRIEQGCLVLNGKGATVIMGSSPDGVDGQVAPVPREWSLTGPVPAEVIRSTRLLRERLLADPWRPCYHFCTPEDMGLPGDPNGAFYHDGRYHLMYLYNRNGAGFSWGHVSSTDLVHWRHHPDAIGPSKDEEGCFSGGAFVDDDGTAWLSYWIFQGPRGIGLARSSDRLFERWKKLEANPVIRSTEWGITEVKGADGAPRLLGSADPSNIWKKGGHYYMLTGNLLVLNKIGRAADAPVEEQGDRLYLFTSDDLEHWRHLHVFYTRNTAWTDRSEDNMCPSFLPLPAGPEGGPPSGKHLLLFISHNKGCQYYVGDYRDDHFSPGRHGRMTWVDNTCFAPEALVDGQGRQIMWAWLTDNPAGDEQRGWSGVFGLPRTLWLGEDGSLRMRPVRELERLRLHEKTWTGPQVSEGHPVALEGVIGDSCELQVQIATGTATRCGVKVRASPDGREETLLCYDARAHELVFDATRSGVTGRMVVERAPLALNPGGVLELRVFVDRSVVEVYANDRQAIARRVYPGRAESSHVFLFCEGGTATFKTVTAWEMAAANGY